MVKSLVSNPLLKYSAEKLLHEANPKGKPYFKDTHFNKMIFLVYKSLKEQDIDIELPYCWYKHGTLIHRDTFYHRVGLPIDYYISRTNKNSTRAFPRLPKSDLKSSIRRIIDEVVLTVISNFRKNDKYFIKGYLTPLLDADYAYAPYEFQRIFKRGFEKYLNDFKTPARKQIPRHLSLSTHEVECINNYLDELICVFPDDFETLKDGYLDWDDTVRICLDCDQDAFLKNVDNFWEIFSKYLRISHYENIPPEHIENWKFKLFTQEYPSYQDLLALERKRLLKVWESHTSLNEATLDRVKKVNKIAFECAIRRS